MKLSDSLSNLGEKINNITISSRNNLIKNKEGQDISQQLNKRPQTLMLSANDPKSNPVPNNMDQFELKN